MACSSNNPDIYRIEINRPPVNALDSDLLKKLTLDIRKAPDENAKVIILSGVPGSFSAGMDKKHMQSISEQARKILLNESLSDLMRTVAHCPVPIVSAITGHCLGAGAALAALCDYRIMAEGDYKMGLPEVNIGLVLPVRIRDIFARIVGDHIAQRMCVEGYLMDPQQALQAGLVDEVVELNEVKNAAIRWSEHMLSLPRDAMLSMRASCREKIRNLYE